MATKDDLKNWVVDALREHGGNTHHIQVAKHIWENHQAELIASGDLFYSWQYDIRWTTDHLRREGRLLPKPKGQRGPWRLAK